MKKIVITALLALALLNVGAQKTDYPLIGAQIFIEPGQSEADIDQFFSIMEENNMRVGRIRMFGAHMMGEDGSWDYSLYDHAFDAAERHGVKLFATLFPPTDELNDVGGFKFPSSKKHLDEIAEYIKGVVTHFAGKPALYAWVLQNEPGNGSIRFPETDLSRELYREWRAGLEKPAYDNGYLKADFSREHFLVYYTDWYLGWISSQIDIYDTEHYKHINPHQIFETLPEYDFNSYSRYLTSMGISMHFSWHFGYFDKAEYPLGVSVMSDLIRPHGHGNPYWITEMQGGNVTASGDVPYCPTGEEIRQYLWTGIGAGCEGVIFWSLNQRSAALESGEWGLIDFLRRPSDRLEAAAQVARKVEEYAGFFRNAVPAESPVTLLYNNESIWTQKKNAAALPDSENEGRKGSAVMKSLVSAYKAFSVHGVSPSISTMDDFDWEGRPGRVAVIPDMVSLPSRNWDDMRRFVNDGGKLIVTGLSGYYDENMYCLFMNGFPLADLFGGTVSEFKYTAPLFAMEVGPAGQLPVHMWKGIIEPAAAAVIGTDNGDVTAIRNIYGKGEVIWVPSLIDLGGWLGCHSGLQDFYGTVCREAIEGAVVSFAEKTPGVLMRSLTSGDRLMTVIVNKNDSAVTLRLNGNISSPVTIDGNGNAAGKTVSVGADSCLVTLWEKGR